MTFVFFVINKKKIYSVVVANLDYVIGTAKQQKQTKQANKQPHTHTADKYSKALKVSRGSS